MLIKARRRSRKPCGPTPTSSRSEEHTSELQSLMRISYAVFCLKKKNKHERSYFVVLLYITSNNDTNKTTVIITNFKNQISNPITTIHIHFRTVHITHKLSNNAH